MAKVKTKARRTRKSLNLKAERIFVGRGLVVLLCNRFGSLGSTPCSSDSILESAFNGTSWRASYCTAIGP